MGNLPLFHKGASLAPLIVGGGEIALRKLRLINSLGISCNVISKNATEAMRAQCTASGSTLTLKPIEQNDLAGYNLVVSATDIRAVNEQVADWCKGASIPVNVVDDAELSTVIMPAMIDRRPLQIAISTDGAAPVYARRLRARLEQELPAGLGKALSHLRTWRDRIKQQLAPERRRGFYEQLLDGSFITLASEGQLTQADQLVSSVIDKLSGDTALSAFGHVALVGAGPGNPDLLSLRAIQLLQQADIILYDRLVNEAILDYARRDAERLFVGKAKSNHAVPQSTINELLVEYAQQGMKVVRLKGGDPFIFGRGGEELEQVAAKGISFEVVPGITAASACGAYAGIPLTHRDHAQSVRFLTGHLKQGELNLPWHNMLDTDETLVFYMGVGAIGTIASSLIGAGRAAATPVAMVEKGSQPDQRVITGSLNDIANLASQHAISSPALIIVGSVVSLHDQLSQ